MKKIELTERQALICERALDMVQNGRWPQFQQDMREFSGTEVSDDELEKLTEALQD